MCNYELIKEAILCKKQIWAEYNCCKRKMCPHILGKSKEGVIYCLFYQFAGDSKSGLSKDPSRNWRLVNVSQLKNIIIHDGEWFTSLNYKKEHPGIVYVQWYV